MARKSGHGRAILTSRREFLKTSAAAAAGLGFASPLHARREPGAAEEFDYVIVGGGSAGCVLARRLSEAEGVSVLLLEAGGPDSKPEIHSPSQWGVLRGSEVDWKYRTDEEPFLGGRMVDWPRGKVLGGSSSINLMLYVRGHRWDYDQWAAQGNRGWAYRDVLPYFLRSEDNEGGASEYHGAGGPLRVSNSNCSEPLCSVFMDAALELGYEGPEWDFNGARQENGAGLYQLTIKEGRRHSAAAAFLTPILARPNLTVRPWSHASRILFEGDRAAVVEYLHAGEPSQVRARREIIVSAGVVESPKLLLLSGIGPANQLRSHGIPVVVDLPGVGENLHDHLSQRVSFGAKTRAASFAPPECAGLFFYSRHADRSTSPDLQFMFYHLPAEQGSTFRFLPIVARPLSRGSLSLRSADPLEPPRIQANYLQREADLDVLVEGFQHARELAGTRAFAAQSAGEIGPGAATRSRSEIREFLRSSASTMYHPVGTCKMGSDPMAVVNPALEVRGVRGLRVADASVMPSIVNGNTNAACLMIAEKAAAMIQSRGA